MLANWTRAALLGGDLAHAEQLARRLIDRAPYRESAHALLDGGLGRPGQRRRGGACLRPARVHVARRPRHGPRPAVGRPPRTAAGRERRDQRATDHALRPAEGAAADDRGRTRRRGRGDSRGRARGPLRPGGRARARRTATAHAGGRPAGQAGRVQLSAGVDVPGTAARAWRCGRRGRLLQHLQGSGRRPRRALVAEHRALRAIPDPRLGAQRARRIRGPGPDDPRRESPGRLCRRARSSVRSTRGGSHGLLRLGSRRSPHRMQRALGTLPGPGSAGVPANHPKRPDPGG